MNSRKKIKQNRTTWSDAAEMYLIDIWQQKIPELRSARKNSHIYEEICSELSKAGFTLTAAEIRIKIHNLTNRYRAEKAKVGPSGGSPSKWKHYHAVHYILGSFKSFNATDLVEDSIMEDVEYLDEAIANGQSIDFAMQSSSESSHSGTVPELTESQPLHSPSPSGSGAERTPVKKNIPAQMLQLLERMHNGFEKFEEEARMVEAQKIVLLEKYVADFGEMKNSIVKYLDRQT